MNLPFDPIIPLLLFVNLGIIFISIFHIPSIFRRLTPDDRLMVGTWLFFFFAWFGMEALDLLRKLL